MAKIIKLWIVISILVVTMTQAELMGYYSFNGNAQDSGGNGNHGTVYGAVLANDRHGNANSAYSFDGNNDYINAGSSNGYNDLWNAITISAWVQTPSAPGVHKGIVSKGTNASYNNFDFNIEPNGTVRFWFHDVSASSIVYSSTSMGDGEWHHIVAVWDGTYNCIYVDGVLEDEMPNAPTIVASGAPLLIGSWNTSPGWYWKGMIDEVSIYNEALSPTTFNFPGSTPVPEPMTLIMFLFVVLFYGFGRGNIKK